MLTYTATLLSLILPALALVTPQRSLQGRAGAAIGNTYAGAPVSNITVKADNVVQCGTAYISWTGATDPVSLFIALGGFYVGETPITTLRDLRGGSTTWLVNQPAGKTMEFRVTDAKGAVAYVQNIKIGAGDIWCVENGASASVVATTSVAAWSESAVPVWTPEPSTAVTSSAGQAAAVVASSTTPTPSPSPKTSTSSSKSSTANTSMTSTTVIPTTPIVISTTSASSSANNASLAGAGAGASASARSGASRGVAFGSGALAMLVSVMALGLAL